MAAVDVVGTLALAWAVPVFPRWGTAFNFAVYFLVAIGVHALFGIRTAWVR